MALSLGLIFLASISSAASAPAHSTSTPACMASMDGKLPSITPTNFHFSGNVRRYYVAAKEIVWDYAPSGWDNTMGVPIDVSPKANVSGYNMYGTKWKKAVYRGYTDATFTEETVQSTYQGLQGPTLRSEVGDMVEILFVNNLHHNWASMHSMGLSYTKTNEGSLYPNGSRTVTPGDEVPPGGCAVYKWVVPESAAPPKGEPAKMHGYHSYISMLQDINGGLAGPQVVYQRGMMEKTMADYTEVPLFYMGIQESASILASENARWLANSTTTPNITATLEQLSVYGNTSYELPQVINMLTAEGFEEAPEFYTINGYTLANNPPFNYGLNENVIYYFYGEYICKKTDCPSTRLTYTKCYSNSARN